MASALGTCLWDAGWALAGLISKGITAGPSLICLSFAFVDSGQYLSSGEGMFRRPSEGQSLISYLSEQDFGSCADLEKVREAAAVCALQNVSYCRFGDTFLRGEDNAIVFPVTDVCTELQG